MTDVKRIEPTKNRGGVWVQMGDEEYRIPPLAFGSLKDIGDDLKGLAGIERSLPNASQLEIVGRIISLAMRRNYPDMTTAEITDMLDLGNFRGVLTAVMGISGFVRTIEGEGSGEAKASIGTVSTSA